MKTKLPVGLAVVGPSAAAPAAAPAPDGLPRLRINNSIPPKSKGYRFQERDTPLFVQETETVIVEAVNGHYEDEPYEMEIPTGRMVELKTDIYGTKWTEDDGGYQKRISAASSRDRKTCFALIENLKDFVNCYGRDHCAFWTITSPDECSPREFALRWNSFLANHGGFIVDYGRVLEPQENGRPHYHFVVAVRWNMEPDKFDWEASIGASWEFKCNGRTPKHRELTARYVASAAEQTRKKWGYLRRVLPKYKLGRSEFLPIRSVGEAIAKYVGHYLDAGLQVRKDEWKGCRRVEWSRRTKIRRLQVNGFAFANFTENKKTGVYGTGGPRRKWREHCDALLAALGGREEEDVQSHLGKKWQWRYREALTGSDEHFADWLKTELPIIVLERGVGLPFREAPQHEPLRRRMHGAERNTARPEGEVEA